MDRTDICNLALQMLGNYRIHDIDEDSEPARVCRSFYYSIRDGLLRDHVFTFSTEFVTLSKLDETSPDSRYPNVFQRPVDDLRVIELDEPLAKFRLIGRKLLADYEPVILTYVKRVIDTTQYDPLFIGVLQYHLAAELAVAFTHDAKLAGWLAQEARIKLQNAKSVDAQENVRGLQPREVESNFLNSRN